MSFAESDQGPYNRQHKQRNHAPEGCTKACMQYDLTTYERPADPPQAAGGIDIREKTSAVLRLRDIGYRALSDRNVGLAQSPNETGEPQQDEIALTNSK